MNQKTHFVLDGVRPQPLIGALALAALATACRAGPPEAQPNDMTLCPEQRPEVCTQQYDPVCGVFQPGSDQDGQVSALEWLTGDAERAGRTDTFGNACSACAQSKVIGFRTGACPDRED